MAEAVGRPVYELEVEMPVTEILEWRAFWKLRNEAEAKQTEKAKREARQQVRRPRR